MITRRLLFAAALLCSSILSADEPPIRRDAGALQARGVQHFYAGRIKEALADWDRVIKLLPDQAPHHWQRGIALYYAGEYEKGVAQFESHQTVNQHDVENAAWHFICAVRTKDGSVEKAREGLIPIVGDTRVPMKEIHHLFAGTGTAEQVLAAAREGNPAPKQLRNNLCYAHLYLALYYEALGEDKKAARHIRKAAFDHRMDHYMGKVAQVHAQLRGVTEEDEKKAE